MPDILAYKDGLYTLKASDKLPAKKGNPPILCVHPFFLFDDSMTPEPDSMDQFCTATPEDYLDQLKDLLHAYTGPILTFEEVPRLDQTAELIHSLHPMGPRLFVRTYVADPTPKGTTFAHIGKKLLDYGASTIPCVGGYLDYESKSNENGPIRTPQEFSRRTKDGSLGGCLGWAMQTLKEEQDRLDLRPQFPLVFGRV